MNELQTIYNLQHKILRHPEHLAIWKAGGTPPPISTELFATNECNNSCSFCYFRTFHKKRDSLTLSQMISYIAQIADINGKAVVFSGGGEPLLNPHTPNAVKYAKSIGLDIGFITNGQCITEQIAETLLSSCVWVRISLSATTSQTFEAIRGVDKFHEALQGIRTLTDAKMSMGATQQGSKERTDGQEPTDAPEGLRQMDKCAEEQKHTSSPALPHTRSNCTIGLQWIYTKREPISYLINFIREHCQNKGIDYIQIIAEQTHHIQRLVNQRDLIEHIRKLQILCPSNPQIIYSKADDLLLPNFGRDYPTCEGHWFTAVIAADAKVYLCCHLSGQTQYEIGDLTETSFEAIWHGEKRKRVAETIDVSKCLHICKHHEINKLLHQLKKEMPHENFI